MSLWLVVVGSFIQMSLAGFMFMFTLFAMAAAVNEGQENISKLVKKTQQLAILVLPMSAIFSLAVVIYFYFNNGTDIVFLWYFFPVVLFVLYLVLT